MSDRSPNFDPSNQPPDEVTTDLQRSLGELLQSLRRKEGSWVEWAKACQTLQKAGYDPQVIFEETGFEPIQQNQIIVAAQVYDSLVAGNASDATRHHFGYKGSDVLYEFRILTQADRVAAAELALAKQLDMDEAHEVAKALKDFSRLGKIPDGFTDHAGDAIAYQTWKHARQKSDLQERSRLIAKGLRFVHSDTARQQIEKLLTDFTVTPATPAPLLPLYRPESADEMPRILAVAGKLPLTKADLQAVPFVDAVGVFQLVQFSGTGAWVAVPGWQVILMAEDPIAVLCDSDALPSPLPGQPEEVLIVIDRAQREWQRDRYFIVEQGEQLQIQWFEQAPELPLLGQLLLIMRPKKILDEDYTKDPWQLDE
ncbi:RuBisCO accumulation factor 1 [Pantanalinema sp. GBBB05]|uniref:RuBisCO accumulation factor 1 n=1 Tax=Pantanalinema sp. GBBB05 TaxID=2604139 RepID=UPI003D81854E